MSRRQQHQQQRQRPCLILQQQPMVKEEINSFMRPISFRVTKAMSAS